MHLQLCDKCHGNPKDPNYDPTLKGRRNCAVCSLWTGHKDSDWLIIDSKVLEKKYPVNATSHCSENDLVGLDAQP